MSRFVSLSRLGRLSSAPAIAALLGSTLLSNPAHAAGGQLALVAYSTPQTAYSQIIPAFARTKAGTGVTFTQSYGASADQANAVANGQPADIVNLSLEPDISTLVKKGLVSPSWYKNAYHGFVTDSVVAFAVRPGNPLHIHTWNDLLKSGVNVLNPNPFTSGGARWNIMAAYGAQLYQHRTKQQAVAYLTKLFSHIQVQSTSARTALATFVSGEGDVMLGYQNEMLTAQKAGAALDVVVPPQSILIENPIAVTTETKNAGSAKAFVAFLWSKTGQRIFGQNYYIPVRKDVASQFHLPKPRTLFTIRNLGSWPRVMSQFFDPSTGIVAKIERGKGVTP